MNAKRNGSSQSGFSLIYVILLLVATSTLAASLAALTQTGMTLQLNDSAVAQARYIALAGFNYVRQFKEDYDELEGKTFNFGQAGQFVVTQLRKLPTMAGLYEVRLVGTANPGTTREANYVIFQEFVGEDQGAITFRENFDDFTPITSDAAKTPIIKNSNKTFTIGANQNYAFGAMYYTGTKTLNWGNNVCTLGYCDFKEGFRLFFVSTYSVNNADGIVFTWFNGDNNTTSSIGGSSELGEMIGYAGDSRVYTGSNGTYGSGNILKWVDPARKGISPPKMGIEFDNYTNSGTDAICPNSTAQPAVGKRRDTNTDHIAYVFWGLDSPGTSLDCAYWKSSGVPYTDGSNQATWAGAYTFDDNRHDAGFNTPKDKVWNTTFAWNGNTFAFRAEVERDTSPNGDGKYEYTIKSWVRQCSQPLCKEYFDRGSADTNKDKLYFSDTSRFMCDASGEFAADRCTLSNPPILTQTVALTEAQHTQFNKMIFGFTEATGGATQNATYSEFILQFVKPNDYLDDGSGTLLKRRVINRCTEINPANCPSL